jgi:hypothetical protein
MFFLNFDLRFLAVSGTFRSDRKAPGISRTYPDWSHNMNTPDLNSLMAQIEALKAQNAALKAKSTQPMRLTLKVSEKGAMSLYGMGRFPVTLYQEQWLKVLSFAEEIKTFIKTNESRLKTKEDAVLAAALAK